MHFSGRKTRNDISICSGNNVTEGEMSFETNGLLSRLTTIQCNYYYYDQHSEERGAVNCEKESHLVYMRILVFASGAVCFALDKCWALENSNVLIQSFVMPRPVLRFSQTDLKPCNVPPCIKHYERLIHGFVNAHPALSIHSSTVSTWLRVVLPLLLVFLTNRISGVFFIRSYPFWLRCNSNQNSIDALFDAMHGSHNNWYNNYNPCAITQRFAQG